MTIDETPTFGQRRSMAFNRAVGRHKGWIALCCAIAFLQSALAFDPVRPFTVVLQGLGYAAQIFLLYNVHRTTLLDAGSRRQPSLIDTVTFAALSAGLFLGTFALSYGLQAVFLDMSEQSDMSLGEMFWSSALTSVGPVVVMYLIVFPMIALCFPSLAYDGRLRLAENFRAGLKLWPKTLWRIIVAVLPWIALGLIVGMVAQGTIAPVMLDDFTELAAGKFTASLLALGAVSAIMTFFGTLAVIGVAVTLSEMFRDHGPIAGARV